METTALDRRMRTLSLARECARLGARARTIAYVTGLSRAEVLRLVFDENEPSKSGKFPKSVDWLHKCNLFAKVEASAIVATFRRLRELGMLPADALPSAYRQYRRRFPHESRLDFDRAFDLVCHTDGIWAAAQPSMTLHTCAACSSRYLSSLGARRLDGRDCPFCKLLRRYYSDPRVRLYLSGAGSARQPGQPALCGEVLDRQPFGSGALTRAII